MKVSILAALALIILWYGSPAPGLQESLFESSSKKMQAGDYEGAESGFLKILQSDPNNVSALGNLGIVYTRTHRDALAIKTYQKALRISPNEHGVLLNLGLIYLKQDNYEQARPYFRKLHDQDPKNVQAANLLATSMIYGGQPNAGIGILKPILGDNPDNGTLYLMGVAHCRAGQTVIGEKVFGQLFPDAASNPKSRFLLGQAHYDSLEYALAERDFREVLGAEPNFPGVHRALGKDYVSDHRYDEAEKEFRAALEQDPKDENSVYFLGALLAQTEKYAESVPYLERAHEADPSSWATLFYLGKAKLKLDELDASIQSFKEAANLNPNEAAVFYLLGIACRKAGRPTEAKAALQRVSELHTSALNAQKKALLDQGIVGVR